jgi:AraC-like DNA-binding protein
VTPPTEWETFAAQKAVDFVAQVPKAFPEQSQSHFAANVRSLRSVTFQGNKSVTARAILHSRKTIECWCDESQNPMLLSLLMLSFRLGVEPLSLLTEDVSDQILVGSNAPGGSCLPVVRRTARRHSRKRLHTALARILGEKEDPPPSMHKIGLRLKCHQSYLARAFPDLIAELKSRHQSCFEARRDVRRRMVRDLIRSATLKTHSAGLFPSANRVCRGLPRFVDMRDPAAREEWKKTLTELGLHHEER